MKVSFGRVVLPILALAMGGLGFYHVHQTSQNAPLTSPVENPPQAPFAHVVAGSGLIEAQTENIGIGTALSGLVLEVFVPSSKVGLFVKAGTPLFRVDDRSLKAQLAVAQAQLHSAKANLAKLEKMPRPEELPPSLAKVKAATAKAALQDDQFQRAKKVLDKNAISEEEYLTRKFNYETALHEQAQAQAEYDLLKAGAWKPDKVIAEAAIAEAKARVQQLKTEIERALVLAPVDGVILQVNIRPGERITDMDTKALMVLGDTKKLHVRVDIDERDIPRFKPGAPAKAYPRGKSSCELDLHFVRVEPYVIPKKSLTGDNTERVDTRVLQVIYAIELGQAQVYVGQQLDVFIRSEE